MDDPRRELYERQMALLKKFLENGNITEAQYRKSAGDLTKKMMPEQTESR